MEQPSNDNWIVRSRAGPGQRCPASKLRRWRLSYLVQGCSLLIAVGCGSATDSAEPKPPTGLFVESIVPATRTTIPSPAVVRARLRYRFDSADSGHIAVLLTCTVQDYLACLDAATLATVSGQEGTVDVAFSIRAPAGAKVNAELRLLTGARVSQALIALTYTTAP